MNFRMYAFKLTVKLMYMILNFNTIKYRHLSLYGLCTCNYLIH